MTDRVDPQDVDPGPPSWQTLYERERDLVNKLVPALARLRENNNKAGVDLDAAYLQVHELEAEVTKGHEMAAGLRNRITILELENARYKNAGRANVDRVIDLEATVRQLEAEVQQYRKAADQRSPEVIVLQDKVLQLEAQVANMADEPTRKELERQIRAHDKTIRNQADELEFYRNLLGHVVDAARATDLD